MFDNIFPHKDMLTLRSGDTVTSDRIERCCYCQLKTLTNTPPRPSEISWAEAISVSSYGNYSVTRTRIKNVLPCKQIDAFSKRTFSLRIMKLFSDPYLAVLPLLFLTACLCSSPFQNMIQYMRRLNGRREGLECLPNLSNQRSNHVARV